MNPWKLVREADQMLRRMISVVPTLLRGATSNSAVQFHCIIVIIWQETAVASVGSKMEVLNSPWPCRGRGRTMSCDTCYICWSEFQHSGTPPHPPILCLPLGFLTLSLRSRCRVPDALQLKRPHRRRRCSRQLHWSHVNVFNV